MNNAEVAPQRACHKPRHTNPWIQPVKGAASGKLPIASRDMLQAVRQVAEVVSVLADADAHRRDVAGVRDVLSMLQLTDCADRVAELSCVGFFLGCVPPPHASALAASIDASTDFIHSSAPSRDTLARLLCRVCLRYACRLHGSCPHDPLSAPPPARPSLFPPTSIDRPPTSRHLGGQWAAPHLRGRPSWIRSLHVPTARRRLQLLPCRKPPRRRGGGRRNRPRRCR